jgi:hypothetical protein
MGFSVMFYLHIAHSFYMYFASLRPRQFIQHSILKYVKFHLFPIKESGLKPLWNNRKITLLYILTAKTTKRKSGSTKHDLCLTLSSLRRRREDKVWKLWVKHFPLITDSLLCVYGYASLPYFSYSLSVSFFLSINQSLFLCINIYCDVYKHC